MEGGGQDWLLQIHYIFQILLAITVRIAFDSLHKGSMRKEGTLGSTGLILFEVDIRMDVQRWCMSKVWTGLWNNWVASAV